MTLSNTCTSDIYVLMTLTVPVILVFHMLLTLSNTYADDISRDDEFVKYLQLLSHRMLC